VRSAVSGLFPQSVSVVYVVRENFEDLRGFKVGPYLSCVTTEVTLIGNSAWRVSMRISSLRVDSRLLVTTEVTLFGNSA
jgi:hypothetical protein